jgi:hypothetical protein
MTEEERLELVSTVEDDFSADLEKLEQDLESIDHQIAETGHGIDEVEIEVSTTGVAETMAELEALERQLDSIDNEIDASAWTAGDGGDVATPDGGGATPDGGDGGSVSESFRHDTPGAAAAMAAGIDASEVQQDLRKMGVKGEGFTQGLTDDDDLDLSFRRLKEEVIDLQFTMGTFHDLFASVLPLVGVFAGALPAAIAGVAALGAAALGAAGVLAGIGALGARGMSLQQTGEVSMEPIAEQLSQLSSAFVDAFAPLAQSLAPTVENAFETIEQMFGPLATASQGLLAFRDEFTALVEGIAGALPGVIRNVLAFTDAVMPMIQGVISFIAEQDILGMLASHLNEAWPELQNMGEAIVQILPAIMSLSQGFLVVASTIMEGVGAIAWMINVLGPFGEILGVAVGVMFTIVAVSSLWTTINTALTGSILSQVVPAVQTWIASNIGLALSTWQVYAALVAVITVATLGIGAVLGFAGSFGVLSGNVSDARKELEKFANTQSSMRGMGGDLGGSGLGGGGGPNVYNDQSTTVIYADNRDDAARQQYSSEFERRQHRDSVFGG